MSRPRLHSVDLLRGLVMVVMALDHTRDFVHSGAMAFRPEDLTKTTAAIFMTRWVTHFCAPVFMLCAGVGAFLRLERSGGSKADLSRFLWTRGLWLIVLEVTVVRLGFFFNVKYDLVILLVFWALGLSMIALAALIWLPFRALLAVSLGMILLHHLLDKVQAASLGASAWLWRLLHEPGLVMAGPPTVVVGYPLIPWVGVMAAGFCLGHVYRMPAEVRAKFLVRLGLGLTAAFVILRAVNTYGDPSRWSSQPTPLFTVLSFLNTTKYPPSLLFLLMTLGPAIALLGWIDLDRRGPLHPDWPAHSWGPIAPRRSRARARVGDSNPVLVFGRTPLFYFVLHLPLIHAVAIGMTWLRYGAAPFLFTPPPTLGTPRNVFPPDYGWSLGTTYLVWIAVVVALYPVCLWWMRLKQRRSAWWTSYL